MFFVSSPSSPPFTVITMVAMIALMAVAAAESSLLDHPIAASMPPVYLDGITWTVSTKPPMGLLQQEGQEGLEDEARTKLDMTVPASVPGDLLTDLQRASVIADPWRDITWINNSSLWNDHAWTYTTYFGVSDAVSAKTSLLLLTFDGVKMGATVRVNGHTVGVVRDQFLRYSFTLDPDAVGLLPGLALNNRLDITFGVGDVAEDGRFMVRQQSYPFFGGTPSPLPPPHTHTHTLYPFSSSG